MNAPEIVIQRRAQRLASFNADYQAKSPEREKLSTRFGNAIRDKLSWNLLFRRFPIIGWMRHYNFKEDLVADLIAGLTIAIFQVPQGMAYAMLAEVPPVYGLYTSFFPVLIYALMGTSKQASVGTFAITSLMTGVLVRRYATAADEPAFQQAPSMSINNATGTEDTFMADFSTLMPSDFSTHMPPAVQQGLTRIQVAGAVALLIGIYQIFYGLLGLGSLSVYLSKHLVSGFTCASAFYVATSQLKSLFGLTLEETSGPLGFIYTYIYFFKSIQNTNLVTLGLSASALAVLILFKEVINPKLAKYTRVPFPIELVMVVIGTVISYFLDLHADQSVKIVGEIKTGFPSPSAPWTMDTLASLATGCIALSIVCFSSSISLGKLFAQKYNYEIDANQELLAVGSANVLGSFFSCIPSCASISRSSVQDGAGGRTQLVSLINCVGILVVLLALGHLLTPLPTCVLSSIILVSLKGMLLQVKDFWRYFRVSWVDGFTWLVTFVAVILLDVDYGLGVGVAFAILTLVVRSQRPKTFLMGILDESDIYVALGRYASAREINGVKIFHFGGPLHFGNVEYFSEELSKYSGISVNALVAKKNKEKKTKTETKSRTASTNGGFTNSDERVEQGNLSENVPNREPEPASTIPDCVVLDCSAMSFLDTSGVTQLKQTFKDYKSVGIDFFVASCSPSVQRMLEKDGFFDIAPSDAFAFPTLHDAMLYATQNNNNKKQDKQEKKIDKR